jgi:hypothetical protein
MSAPAPTTLQVTHITIRDGRAGHAKDPDGRGAVLGVAQRGDFLDIGEVIELPDGTRVVVIGEELILGQAGVLGMDPAGQTVFVGSIPEG